MIDRSCECVVVETVLLGVHQGQLRCRVRQRRLAGGEHPDAPARDLAWLAVPVSDPARLLHSPSSRFTRGTVVLTYAAVPDRHPGDATRLTATRAPPRAGDPLAPALAPVAFLEDDDGTD
jgi:hypothetical protein